MQKQRKVKSAQNIGQLVQQVPKKYPVQIAATIQQVKLNRHAGSQLSRLLSRKQVRPDDQSGYPKDTIESFVGHSSMGLLCPPAIEVYRLFRRVTHTHPTEVG